MINFKNKKELTIGEKVELNVQLKRGKIKKLVINEVMATQIYNYFIDISEKKQKNISITKIEKIIDNQKCCVTIGNNIFEIYPTFNMLKVDEKKKTNGIIKDIKSYYLNV